MKAKAKGSQDKGRNHRKDIDLAALTMPPKDFESALRGLLQTPPPEKRKVKKTKK